MNKSPYDTITCKHKSKTSETLTSEPNETQLTTNNNNRNDFNKEKPNHKTQEQYIALQEEAATF